MISEEEPEDQPERVQERRRPRIRETDRKTPSRRLAKPRVPYLSELAMDMDSTLKSLAWNQPATATGMYMNLLAASVKAGDASAERSASTNLGHVYYLLGRFPDAVKNYTRALSISRRLGDSQGEAISERNLAATFTAAGDFREGEKHNRDALKFFQVGGHARDWQMTLNNLGVL